MNLKWILLRSTFLVVACIVSTSEAASGLRGGKWGNHELQSLLLEVEGYLGRQDTKKRVAHLESTLAPMYATLPKTGTGRLAQPVVRYALHRLFARHGMHVDGLDPQGGAWNDTSTPTAILSERVPSFVESMLEERLADHGFGLHDLATLAVALKHLFQTEASQRLEVAYQIQNIPVGDTLDDARVYEVLDMYMMIYVLEGNLKNASWVRQAQNKIRRIYPGWTDTQMWVHDTRQNLAFAARHTTNPFVVRELDYSDVLRILEPIHEQYGVVQDVECKELKDSLLEHEFGGTGRVRLADFHGQALQGKWQFSEGKNYLRQLGALDESNPQDPRVMVPNYIYAKSNCVAKSGYYVVCCLNECESLQDHLERSIAKPEASPKEVAAVVAHLPSSTVHAPRNLSQFLLERLEAVAVSNGGKVPLHSRLFGQWLHHAYPRECPYPHLAGTTRPLTAQKFMKETGEKHLASKEEMRQHAESASWSAQGAEAARAALLLGDEELLPWSSEEELLYSKGPVNMESVGTRWARSLLMFAGAVALACTLVRTALSAQRSVDSSAVKHYV